MATFGQGINPQLGAIDYSPILRGSLAGAEMSARGSQMIGQGIASLGEEAGKAVQKYYYNKDTKEMLGGVTKRIAGILDKDPYIANKLGLRKDTKTNTWDEKGIAIAVTTIGGGDVRKGVQMTSGLLSDRAAQQVQNSAFLGATAPGVIMPGRETAMYSALGGDNPMGFAQYMQGQELGAANIAEKRSQTELNLATAVGKSPVGKIMSESEFKALDTKKYDVKAELLPDGKYLVKSISPFGPGTQNVINMGENAFNKALGTELAPRLLKNYDNVIDAPNKLEKLYQLQDLVTKGDVTTGAGAEYINALNRVRAQFLGDIKANKTVTNTQILDTLLGAGVFGAISEQKLGSKNFDTPAEMKNIRAAFVGETGFTNDSIRAITDYRIKAEKIAAKRYAADEKAGVYENFYKETRFPKPDFSSIPPEDVTMAQWSVMTPKAKALWNK